MPTNATKTPAIVKSITGYETRTLLYSNGKVTNDETKANLRVTINLPIINGKVVTINDFDLAVLKVYREKQKRDEQVIEYFDDMYPDAVENKDFLNKVSKVIGDVPDIKIPSIYKRALRSKLQKVEESERLNDTEKRLTSYMLYSVLKLSMINYSIFDLSSNTELENERPLLPMESIIFRSGDNNCVIEYWQNSHHKEIYWTKLLNFPKNLRRIL